MMIFWCGFYAKNSVELTAHVLGDDVVFWRSLAVLGFVWIGKKLIVISGAGHSFNLFLLFLTFRSH